MRTSDRNAHNLKPHGGGHPTGRCVRAQSGIGRTCHDLSGIARLGGLLGPPRRRLLHLFALCAAAPLLAVLLIPLPAECQSGGTAGTESILNMGVGSRALGMGGAFTAISDDATSLYWNPAGLCRLEQMSVTGFHSTLFEGSAFDFFSVCQPTVKFGSFGFAFMRVGTDGIQAYDDRSRSLGDIGFSQSEMLFSYGCRIPFNVRVGGSLKIVSERMGDLAADGAGFDFGAMYPFPFLGGVTLGAGVKDFPGARLKLVDRVERIPTSLRCGVSYVDTLREGRDRISLGLDGSFQEKGSAGVFVGGEYLVEGLVALRAGLKAGKLSAGAGVRWRDYSFDYSLGNSELGNLHQFSVSAAFGDPLVLRREREAAERRRELARLMAEEKAERIVMHSNLAKQAFAQGNYSASLEEWNLVLEHDSGSSEAKEYVGRVKTLLAQKTEEEARAAELHARVHVLVEIGNEHLAQGDLRAALLRFRQAGQLKPDDAEALAGAQRADSLTALEVRSGLAMARDLSASGRHLDALSAWNKVLLLQPDNAQAKTGLEGSKAAIEGVGRNLDEARARIDALTLYTSAVRAYERGDYTDAKVKIQDALRLHPTDQEARRLAGRIDERLSPKAPKVEENVRQLYVEGMNYFSAGQYEKAIEAWRKILATDPENELVAKNIEKAKARLSTGERKVQ
ncbi:MAG: PorV/PorQ family protein [Candidatus Eisenbacteria bacterium]